MIGRLLAAAILALPAFFAPPPLQLTPSTRRQAAQRQAHGFSGIAAARRAARKRRNQRSSK